jgi:hypothetical protein
MLSQLKGWHFKVESWTDLGDDAGGGRSPLQRAVNQDQLPQRGALLRQHQISFDEGNVLTRSFWNGHEKVTLTEMEEDNADGPQMLSSGRLSGIMQGKPIKMAVIDVPSGKPGTQHATISAVFDDDTTAWLPLKGYGKRKGSVQFRFCGNERRLVKSAFAPWLGKDRHRVVASREQQIGGSGGSLEPPWASF